MAAVSSVKRRATRLVKDNELSVRRFIRFDQTSVVNSTIMNTFLFT